MDPYSVCRTWDSVSLAPKGVRGTKSSELSWRFMVLVNQLFNCTYSCTYDHIGALKGLISGLKYR